MSRSAHDHILLLNLKIIADEQILWRCDLHLFNSLDLVLARFFTGGTLFLGRVTSAAHSLLQDANDIEVLLVEEDALFAQIVRNDALLLSNGLGAAVDLLQKHLHEVGLADCEVTHLLQMVSSLLPLRLLQRVSEPLARLLLAGEFGFASE